MSKALFAVLLAVVAVAFVIPHLRKPLFTPDGVIYARMMLADRGVPQTQARDDVRAFYLTTPLARDSRYRPFLLDDKRGMFTSTAKPFASRVLYPWIAAAFFPWQHYYALPLVSAVAYVIATLLMYWMLLAFCAPLNSALGALLFAAAPIVRDFSAAALTDMLAISLLIATFGAMVRYALHGGNAYLALALACEIGLSVTRPLPYVPLGAALGLAAYAFVTQRDIVLLRRAALLSIAAIIAWGAYALAAMLTHTPSLSTHLHWLYDAAKTHWLYGSTGPLSPAEQHSFGAWYGHQVVLVARAWIKSLAIAVYPPIALIVCACGLYAGRKSPVSWMLAAGILACCFGIFANPIELELRRLIGAPATIGVVGGIAMLLESIRVRKIRLASTHA
jgi:hypothetical protein